MEGRYNDCKEHGLLSNVKIKKENVSDSVVAAEQDQHNNVDDNEFLSEKYLNETRFEKNQPEFCSVSRSEIKKETIDQDVSKYESSESCDLDINEIKTEPIDEILESHNNSKDSVKTIDKRIQKNSTRNTKKLENIISKLPLSNERKVEPSEEVNTVATETEEDHEDEKILFSCKICKKTFAKKSSLSSHKKIHTGETPYRCQFCNKGFNQRSNLSVHIRIHTGAKPHACDICEKAFTQAGQLKQHLRIHKGEKPYPCLLCSRSFRNSSGLVTHQRTHTGERPFPCDTCERSFTTSTSLKTHRVTHTSLMSYTCPMCGRQFNRRNNLNVHIKRHDKNRSFSCPMCSNGFVMRAHMLNHLRRSHHVEIHDDDDYKYSQVMGKSVIICTDTNTADMSTDIGATDGCNIDINQANNPINEDNSDSVRNTDYKNIDSEHQGGDIDAIEHMV